MNPVPNVNPSRKLKKRNWIGQKFKHSRTMMKIFYILTMLNLMKMSIQMTLSNQRMGPKTRAFGHNSRAKFMDPWLKVQSFLLYTNNATASRSNKSRRVIWRRNYNVWIRRRIASEKTENFPQKIKLLWKWTIIYKMLLTELFWGSSL